MGEATVISLNPLESIRRAYDILFQNSWFFFCIGALPFVPVPLLASKVTQFLEPFFVNGVDNITFGSFLGFVGMIIPIIVFALAIFPTCMGAAIRATADTLTGEKPKFSPCLWEGFSKSGKILCSMYGAPMAFGVLSISTIVLLEGSILLIFWTYIGTLLAAAGCMFAPMAVLLEGRSLRDAVYRSLELVTFDLCYLLGSSALFLFHATIASHLMGPFWNVFAVPLTTVYDITGALCSFVAI